MLFKDAREDELTYWKVREVLQQNPELLIAPTPGHRDKIRNLIVGGKHAYIGVRTFSELNTEQ